MISSVTTNLAFIITTDIEGVTAGVASFVVQEEFDRYTGYWWRPAPKGGYGNACPRSGSAMHLDTTDEVTTNRYWA